MVRDKQGGTRNLKINCQPLHVMEVPVQRNSCIGGTVRHIFFGDQKCRSNTYSLIWLYSLTSCLLYYLLGFCNLTFLSAWVFYRVQRQICSPKTR